MPRPNIYFARRLSFRTAIICLSGLGLAQCERPAPAEPEPAEPATTVAAPLIDPATIKPLSRADFITAAAARASGYALGDGAGGADPLAGRSFEVRIPFGCLGPSQPGASGAADGLARWNWSRDGRSIQISVTPADWTDSAMTMPAEDEDAPWEAVEGFWIPRPWIAAEACPAPRAEWSAESEEDTPEPAGASPQTVGLAAVFEAGGSRIGRRNGQAYSFTVRGEGQAPPAEPAGGYRLVLHGRVTSFPDGRAMRCSAPGPDQRPACVAAVQLDKVVFETAAGAALSEWLQN